MAEQFKKKVKNTRNKFEHFRRNFMPDRSMFAKYYTHPKSKTTTQTHTAVSTALHGQKMQQPGTPYVIDVDIN